MMKIVVPEEMLKAAYRAWHFKYHNDDPQLQVVLEAALRWLAENPVVPTEEQAEDMVEGQRAFERHGWIMVGAVEWQRRMFLAPEPGVPEEIKDLLLNEAITAANFSRPTRGYYNAQIVEAYRRGKNAR